MKDSKELTNSGKLNIKSVTGPVELSFEGDINVEQVSGNIDVQLEGARTRKEDRSSVHVVVGEGKSPVSISTISGPVRIKQRK